MESRSVTTSRSQPSSAHAAIRMQVDTDDDEAEGMDVEGDEDQSSSYNAEVASFHEYPDTRPPTAFEEKKELRAEVSARSCSVFQICRVGDLAALRKTIAGVSAEEVVEIINAADPVRIGMAPLHIAARYNYYNVVVELVRLGADVSKTDVYESTVLHHAARFNPQGSTQISSKGSSMSRDTDSGITTSTSNSGTSLSAEESGNQQTKNDVSSNGKNLKGQSLVKFLVEKGIDVNQSNKNDVTPLHVACLRGSLSRVEELLQIPSINIHTEDKQGVKALHHACTYGHIEIVKLLLEKEADLRARDSKQQTPLHKAVMAGYPGIVGTLLEDAEKRFGPNYKAEMLTDSDANDRVVLQLAAMLGKADVCAVLLRHGADPKRQKQSSGATVLHTAAKTGSVDVCIALIAGGANIDAVNKLKQTPLHIAARFDKAECVNLLLDRGAKVDARDENGFTPLLLASSLGSQETMQVLLTGGASMDVIDSEEKNALHWAGYKGNVAVAKLILAHPSGPNLVNKPDIDGNTPLHNATYRGHIKFVRLLLENGADVSAKNDEEDSVLIYPAANGHTEVVELLLEWDRSLVHQVEELSRSPLELACVRNHSEIATCLIQAGANINTRNDDGIAPLDNAILFGSLKCVKLLLDRGAPVNTADGDGDTPLHNCMFRDHHKIVEELLKWGADAKATSKSGFNALDYALLYKASKSAEVIISSEQWKDALCNWYLDAETGFRQTPLRSLIEHQPELALQVFDKSVVRTAILDESGQEKGVVTYDYTFLDDTEWAERSLKPRLKKCCGCWLGCGSECSSENPKGSDITAAECGDDLAHIVRCRGITEVFDLKKNHPLILMVQHKRMELLLHPLSQALLNYKWRKFGRFVFYSNLALYFIFLVSLTGYALTVDPPVPTFTSDKKEEFYFGGVCVESSNQQWSKIGWRKDHIITYIARPVILALAAANVLREVFQMINRRFVSYFDLENAIDLTCYATAVVFVVDFTDCSYRTGAREPWQWQLGAFSVFLSWINLLLSIRKVPFFGIYVVMVTDVIRTFCKFFLVFMFFIIGFAMAFFILLQQQAPFRSPFEAFVKTFVMMVGDLDFQGIFFESPSRLLYYPALTYALFILFMLVMSIILMNLLVGLAVSDIKVVQDNATLERLAMQTRMVIEVETMLPNCLRKRCICAEETLPDLLPETKGKKGGSGDKGLSGDADPDGDAEAYSDENADETGDADETGGDGDAEEGGGDDVGSKKKEKGSSISPEMFQRLEKSVATFIAETSSAIRAAREEANERAKEIEKQVLESLIQTNAINDVLQKVCAKLDAMGKTT